MSATPAPRDDAEPPIASRRRSLALDPIAQERAGIVTAEALRNAGWSRGTIAVAVAHGRLHRIAPGVYRTDGAPFSRMAARHAALAIVPHAVIARRSAAELHGLVERHHGPIELLVPHQHRSPTPVDDLFRVQRTRSLRDAERCEVHGVAATTPARTLLDLAARTSPDRLAELAAAAFRLQACTSEDVTTVLAYHPRARGRQRLREALDLLDTGAERSRSSVEVAALAHLVSAGMPKPELGYLVRDGRGRIIAELDLAYPELMIAIEIDGFTWHSSPGRKRADEARQNQLVLEGWTVLRFSATDVRHRPDHVLSTVRAALDAARRRS